MARPKKDSAVDLSTTHELSAGLIERLTCPPDAPKAFLRDKDVTGLKVRVTANGVKSFVYEAKLNGKAISRTLGGFPLMSIDDAKEKALSQKGWCLQLNGDEGTLWLPCSSIKV